MRGRRLVALLLTLGGCDRVLRLDPILAMDAAPLDVITGPPTITSTMSAPPTGNESSVMFTVPIPDSSDRLLIVSVATSMTTGVAPPIVQTITAGSVPLKPITVVDGGSARLEQWQLLEPAVGVNEITVMLAGSPTTIHANAMAFAGVSQRAPVRAFNVGGGDGVSSSVMVASADTDLVESTVAQGTGIQGPANGTQAFLDNHSYVDTGDNSAGSTAPGSTLGITMGWTFMGADHWLEIAASLAPAGS